MNPDFPTITILGGGLLGGSMALALAALDNPPVVRLWARKHETVEEALALGIHNVSSDLGQAIQSTDLVVLAVPVGAMPALITSAIQAGLPENCLVTDVGSVKRTPHRSIPPLLAQKNIQFIGSHPMAGSERNGLSAASPSLFANAACLLTNDEGVAQAKAAALEQFWKTIGCRTAWMTAAIHDELVARISHLPHIIAASAARVCLKDHSEGRFGGGGLRDTTRVASGNPSMWAEILLENREALMQPLQESIADLLEIQALLQDSDHQKLLTWLLTAKQRRDPMNSLC